MGEFTVTLREEDLFRGFLLNAAHRHTRPLLLAVAALVALLLALLTLVPDARIALACSAATLVLLGAVLLAATLLAAVLALRRPLLRGLARRTLAQRRELATPIEWSFDGNALRIATRFTRSDLPWDALRGWREDDATLLVYLSDQLFHVVPKSEVEAEAVAELRRALESQGVPRR
jgi:hypothetical protein